MNTPNSQFNFTEWGMPSENSIAELAATYFPEFSSPLGSDPTVPDIGYTPVIIPKDLDYPRATGRTETQNVLIGHRSLESIRADFPILAEKVKGHQNLIWLDNAATTQKPRAVIDRLKFFYEHENSNVHRGAHELAERSTNAYEEARAKIARFLGAPSPENIVYVRGTTEGINLVAQAYVKPLLRSGDEIILTRLEHHANIVPWQLIAAETGAVLKVAPIDKNGQIILDEYERLFNSRTRFVSAAQVSNALGTVAPAAELIQIAHARGVRILIDGAQSVSHIPVNLAVLDPDFFVFSGHKIFGPTGIGAIYGKRDALEAALPYQGGGNMIADVTFERTLYQRPPEKFEAGTGNIAAAAGLGAALDYVSAIGMTNIAAWEHELLRYGMTELEKIPGLRLIGTALEKASVLSFVLEGHSLEEVGQHLSRRGIAVRAGHHCAQPVHRFFGLEGTVRPSLAFYNTPEEIDKLTSALREL
ncbi:MAG: cysteine desulfurase [Spirochaetaceae bacterium]|jgi:cysteine desulfurase/selenocysteine lyase|nr:cysteine desulfurase [Spirochaetaceae bacterium]